MQEHEAQLWLERHVPRETGALLANFVDMLLEEQKHQNLISSATTASVWSRHVLDSAQLYHLAPGAACRWLDIGTGAGFPGMVVGLMREHMTILVEPRTKRADFLRACTDELHCQARISVVMGRCETMAPLNGVDVISARAVAPLTDLFGMAERHATQDTLWLLPKGRTAEADVALAREMWHGDFDLIPSLSDPDAKIVVARHVRRKRR